MLQAANTHIPGISAACNASHTFCSAWHLIPAWHVIRIVIPGSLLQFLNTSLAIYCYLAVSAHAMVYSGGSSTVTEPPADAHVVQCSIDDIVNVYVSSVHLHTICLPV